MTKTVKPHSAEFLPKMPKKTKVLAMGNASTFDDD